MDDIAPFEDRMTYISDLFSLPENIIPFNMILIGCSSGEKGFEDKYK